MNWGCPTCPDAATLGDVVYDAGMLIALAAPEGARARLRHAEFSLTGRPVVPALVVAQAWRGGAKTAHLARALKDCAVVCCYTETEWRRIGELIGRARLNQKKETRPGGRPGRPDSRGDRRGDHRDLGPRRHPGIPEPGPWQ